VIQDVSNGVCVSGEEGNVAVTDANMCHLEAKLLSDTRVTNKSADRIGIYNLISGIIHEHLGLKGGIKAAGKDWPELACASCLLCCLEDSSGKDTVLCADVNTPSHSRNRGSSKTRRISIFLTL
jgi:hypothetical protein